MKPLIVVQNNLVERLTGPVAEWAREADLNLYDISSSVMEDVASLPPGGPWEPIFICGSIHFCNKWARNNPLLTRWVFWNDANFDAALWSEKLEDAYLNHTGRADTIAGFIASHSGPMHIRPRSGIKMIGDKAPTESQAGQESVSGIVATPNEIAARNIDSATPIWISKPTEIQAEVRIWMIAGIPVAASTYRLDGQHYRSASHPLIPEAIRTGEACHHIWHPERHYVVDMALTPKGWKIVEYNPVCSSGHYAADPGKIISAFLKAESISGDESL